MKITVSGWPGAGSTTLALILSKHLNLTYFSGGDIFRYIGANLEFKNTGVDRFKADLLIEEHFGFILDSYIEKILISPEFTNILVESDIASFKAGKQKDVVSMFLITNQEVRSERLGTDGRDLDVKVLSQRDMENRKFYKELHGIDWFSKKQIHERHTLVIDNSYLSIEEEIQEACKQLSVTFPNRAKEISKLYDSASYIELDYWQRGKQGFKDDLAKMNLLSNPKDNLQKIKKYFPNEISKFPDFLKRLF